MKAKIESLPFSGDGKKRATTTIGVGGVFKDASLGCTRLGLDFIRPKYPWKI